MPLKNAKKTKRAKSIKGVLLLWLGMLGLYVPARLSRSFCNAYRRCIFPIWVESMGRLSGQFPFSVGEWELILAVVLLLLWGLLLVWGSFAFGMRRFVKGYSRYAVWIITGVMLVMTCNCFLLYQADSFAVVGSGSDLLHKERPDFGKNPEGKTYSLAELVTVRNYIVDRANCLAVQMNRDADGNVVLPVENQHRRLYLSQKGAEAMTAYGFGGYYPPAKEIYHSAFLSQQHMMGYYFPFSMEANYNPRMYIMNMPYTICHEYAHLKGFILEDDANFIAYLACINSDNLLFQYSGYLGVLNYIDNDLYEALGRNKERYHTYPGISDLVRKDNIFLTREEWEKVEKDSPLKTETVHKASDTFTETTLTLNGVESGMESYGEVVIQLLEYYDGILY